MKNKILLITIICTLFLTIGSVCATDTNITVENTTIIDDNPINTDLDDYNINDDVNDTSNSTNSNNNNFTDIQKLIDETEENNTISLNNTTYYGNGSRIVINKTIIIEGNGAILDAQKLSGIMNITADNVVLKNICFINGGFKNVFDREKGGAIYWLGSNGLLINCSFYNNCMVTYGPGGGAIIWNGVNGRIINSSFINNTFNTPLVGTTFNYSFIRGSIHGYYSGDLFNDAFLENVLINTKPNLTFNTSPAYNNYLLIKILDNNSEMYTNDTIKIIILNKKNTYDLEGIIDANGTVKIKLPSNLTVGNYTIECYLKEITGYSSVCYPDAPLKTIYSNILISNSSLSVAKLNATLKNSNFNTYYNSGKLYNTKLVNNKGVGISGIKIKFSIYSNGKLVKTYYNITNSKGYAYLKTNLKPGKYVVKVESTNPNYNVKSTKSTIKISKAATTISAPKVTKKYHKKAYFKVSAKIKATKKIIKGLKIKIKVYTGKKYKTFNVKTNSKGIAQLNTKSLSKGKHKVVISSGDSRYSVSKISSIKIV